MKKLKAEEVSSRLPGFITLDHSTYIHTKKLALFTDSEYGSWWTTPNNVLRGHYHEKRGRQNAKKTCLGKYGTENSLASPEVQKKVRLTNELRHGVSYPTQSPKIREKVKKSLVDRYGVEHNMQIPGAQDIFKDTMRKRHGVENPGQMIGHRERTVRSSLDKYGEEFYSQTEECKSRIQQTCMKKYGVKNPLQTFRCRSRLFEDRKRNPSKYFHSVPEREILDFVKSLGFEATPHRIGDGRMVFEIDVYIESKKIGIEFNGGYWHSEARPNIYPHYHLDKTRHAEKQGIRLIHVFEHEWRDRKDQVKSFLKSALGKNTHRVGARKCEIREIDIGQARSFLEKYHIQGPGRPRLALGVFYKDELLAVASFSKHHRSNLDWCLSRWSCKTDWNIAGALSRISQLALGVLDTNRLISWCDLRWASEKGFLSAGWKKETILRPDYFYWNTHGNFAVSKQSRKKKNINTPAGMTEHEHAKADGLFRVYDCGKIRFVFVDQER